MFVPIQYSYTRVTCAGNVLHKLAAGVQIRAQVFPVSGFIEIPTMPPLLSILYDGGLNGHFSLNGFSYAVSHAHQSENTG